MYSENSNCHSAQVLMMSHTSTAIYQVKLCSRFLKWGLAILNLLDPVRFRKKELHIPGLWRATYSITSSFNANDWDQFETPWQLDCTMYHYQYPKNKRYSFTLLILQSSRFLVLECSILSIFTSLNSSNRQGNDHMKCIKMFKHLHKDHAKGQLAGHHRQASTNSAPSQQPQ